MGFVGAGVAEARLVMTKWNRGHSLGQMGLIILLGGLKYRSIDTRAGAFDASHLSRNSKMYQFAWDSYRGARYQERGCPIQSTSYGTGCGGCGRCPDSYRLEGANERVDIGLKGGGVRKGERNYPPPIIIGAGRNDSG